VSTPTSTATTFREHLFDVWHHQRIKINCQLVVIGVISQELRTTSTRIADNCVPGSDSLALELSALNLLGRNLQVATDELTRLHRLGETVRDDITESLFESLIWHSEQEREEEAEEESTQSTSRWQ